MEHVTYQLPDMIPVAAHNIQRTQQKQDASLKRLQYLVSGIFRPLDILGYEISLEAENAAAQRYMEILLDCHLLLLNLPTQVNQMRTNLAFQAINPAFYNTASPPETYYVMPITEFQSAVARQVNTAQIFRKTTNKPFRRRFGQSSQQSESSSSATPPQFFRTSPYSQQCGFHDSNNNNCASGTIYFAQSRNTNNPFRKQT
ncbi:MAG: hypothetical protein EXX96DRAFT_590514 [Benjaminiella poitrasii]|nr:MAG: hypothetical protein EXX96DRAFT_590514 [Benjaminiella poitrasii]